MGKKKKPENDEVTLEMVLEVMAEDFPDFVMPIAEENWIRGYQQALSDVDEGQRLMKEAEEKSPGIVRISMPLSSPCSIVISWSL